jgi:hypothetical protein
MAANDVAHVSALENLRSIRTLHQVLMVVSATILAFGLRADPSGDYRASLNELAALKEIQFAGWGRYVGSQFSGVEHANEDFVRSIARLAGVGLAGRVEVEAATVSDDVPFIGTAPLSQYDAFLSGPSRIGCFGIEGPTVDAARELKASVATRNASPKISRVYIEGVGGLLPLPGGPMMQRWMNVGEFGIAHLLLTINDQPQTTPNQPLAVGIRYKIVEKTGPFAISWLRSEPLGVKLIDSSGMTVFPNLKKFWDKINSMTVDQAVVFLDEQLESSSRGTMTFFGIPVERSLAIGAGPAICLSILVFFYMHLKQLRVSATDREVVQSYPWALIFAGWWALVVSLMSVFFLPVGANVCLLLRFGQRRELSGMLGWSFTIFAAVFSVLSLIQIVRVRRLPRYPDSDAIV